MRGQRAFLPELVFILPLSPSWKSFLDDSNTFLGTEQLANDLVERLVVTSSSTDLVRFVLFQLFAQLIRVALLG